MGDANELTETERTCLKNLEGMLTSATQDSTMVLAKNIAKVIGRMNYTLHLYEEIQNIRSGAVQPSYSFGLEELVTDFERMVNLVIFGPKVKSKVSECSLVYLNSHFHFFPKKYDILSQEKDDAMAAKIELVTDFAVWYYQEVNQQILSAFNNVIELL